MSRPTEEIVEDIEAAEIGACGCLLPSLDVTEDTEEGDDDE